MVDYVLYDWMADLDWSAHLRAHDTFLPDAVTLAAFAWTVADRIVEPQPTDRRFLSFAGRPPLGSSACVDFAFDARRNPIHSVHERLGTLIRRQADHFEIGIARKDEISFDEWQAVREQYPHLMLSEGEGARYAAARIAQLLTRFAFDDRIKVLARQIGGGSLEPVSGPAWWSCDPEQAIRRLASCGINLDRPYDEQAAPTHRLFVSEVGLQNAIAAITREPPIHLVGEEFDWGRTRPAQYGHVTEDMAAAFLIDQMRSGRCDDYSNDDWKRQLDMRFGSRIEGRLFERAKAIAVKEPGLERFAKRRPKLNQQR